jgi:predicted PurR-regulated permease PerM
LPEAAVYGEQNHCFQRLRSSAKNLANFVCFKHFLAIARPVLAKGLFVRLVELLAVSDRDINQPFVVGKFENLLVILTGVIGGTLTHGLVGLFLGPVVLSVFYELVVAWTRLDGGPIEAPSADGGQQ